MSTPNIPATDEATIIDRLRVLRDDLLSSGHDVKALATLLAERMELPLEQGTDGSKFVSIEFERESLDVTLWIINELWLSARRNYAAVDATHDELERLFRAEA